MASVQPLAFGTLRRRPHRPQLCSRSSDKSVRTSELAVYAGTFLLNWCWLREVFSCVCFFQQKNLVEIGESSLGQIGLQPTLRGPTNSGHSLTSHTWPNAVNSGWPNQFWPNAVATGGWEWEEGLGGVEEGGREGGGERRGGEGGEVFKGEERVWGCSGFFMVFFGRVVPGVVSK